MEAKPACLGILALLSSLSFAETDPQSANIVATNNAIFNASGPQSTQKYFDVQGTDFGTSGESFAVAEFNAAELGLQSARSVDDLSITLTESNPTSLIEHGGYLNFYLTADNSTSIGSSSPITFAAIDSQGLNNQLSPNYLLGSKPFFVQGTGSADVFTFDHLSLQAQQYLTADVQAGGTLRVIVTPGSSSVAGEFAGFANSDLNTLTGGTLTGPQISVGYTAIPEPDVWLNLSLGVMMTILAGRCRRRTA